MNLLATAADLSNDALLARVKFLAERSRAVTVELIACLAELDVRKHYRGEGPGSLFRYCTEILRFSEAAAFNRIAVARAARGFPVILNLLADGSVNLTTVRLLAPHLSAENHRALLAEATGMTRRQVDKLVARLAPQPDVPSSIRKLPAPTPRVVASAAAPAASRDGGCEPKTPPVAVCGSSTADAPTDRRATAPSPLPIDRAVVAPLSPGRYRVQFTMGKESEEQLRRLQDLLRPEIPDGDAGEIFIRALSLLLRDVEKRKCAATASPRPGGATRPGSRHIPADVERQVRERDRNQCAFVAKNGHRCTERSYVELHHANKPFALGGEATVENMSLRCRAHNDYEARLIFGPYDPSRVRETSAGYSSRDQ